jgi:transcriptional regulator with XRE-family HTH domain
VGKNRSFKEYVSDRFEDEFSQAIIDYIEDEKNASTLDLRLHKVRNIGNIEVVDTTVLYTNISDLPDGKIAFDVAIEAELYVREADYHYDTDESCIEWFMLRCSGDLDKNLNDLYIASVKPYSGKNRMPKPLDDSLVPFIHSDDLETVANGFLERHYSQALKQPMPVDPAELAKAMGLTINIRSITEDFSVFGQLCFRDCTTELYDDRAEKMETVDVQAKTIIVDPKAYFLRNLGQVNNTIVHECVHWDQHRKAFELERLYNESATQICCKVVGGVSGINKSSIDWMEWHANALAPRIQMPLAPFKMKVYELLREYRVKSGSDDILDFIEPLINALAVFYGVSRTAAKIRMVDAGFHEAVGAFNYIDGRYIQTHAFKKDSIKRNQTFSVPAEDAAILYFTSSDFRDTVKDGYYVYVDSHFVINSPKYVTIDGEGALCLTKYARRHMELCCLVFDMEVSSGQKERYHTECFLNKDKDSSVTFEIKYSNGIQNASSEKQKEILATAVYEEAKILEEGLPGNCALALQKMMKYRKVSYAELERRIGLDDQTISRIVNGAREPTTESLVMICLGLHLPFGVSDHIMRSSPCPLVLQKDAHNWYRFALMHKYPERFLKVNDFLAEHGAPLITSDAQRAKIIE